MKVIYYNLIVSVSFILNLSHDIQLFTCLFIYTTTSKTFPVHIERDLRTAKPTGNLSRFFCNIATTKVTATTKVQNNLTFQRKCALISRSRYLNCVR